MNDDKKIESFFEQLRLADKNVHVPAFEEIKSPQKRPIGSLLRLGIAASLLILFGVFTLRVNQKEEVDPHFTEFLPLSIEIESITTNSLIKTVSNIEEWSAPSNSLINHYHEW